MSYVICDKDNGLYLHKEGNNYVLVESIDKATQYDKAKKANNICGSLPKFLRNYNLHVVNTQKILAEEFDDTSEEVELNYNILDKVREIGNIARQVERRKAYLANKVRESDLIIVDIEHAAEFYNLNASQGYKLYKMLHDVATQRRKYKDELQVLGNFLGASIDGNSMDNVEKSIIGLDSRKYAPRIVNELFDVQE